MVWKITTPNVVAPAIGDNVATAPSIPVGTVVRATDPYFGGGEFMLVKSTGTIANGTVCVWDKDFIISAIPNSTLQGRNCGSAVGAFPNSTSWGWLQVCGSAYMLSNATVAAAAQVGITAAGTLGAVAAGKAINGGVSVASQTATVAKTGVSTVNGSTVITVPGGTDGWFVGATMTGTGISGTIASLNQNGREATLSAAATATGIITATATYTGFTIVNGFYYCAQGPIT